MATSFGLPRSSLLSRTEASDPILDKLATTNTFDSDWPTLRRHLYLALLATVPIFASLGPPPPLRALQSPPVPPRPASTSSPRTPSPPFTERNTSTDEGDKPPPESLLLSPSRPLAPLESTTPSVNRHATTPRSVDVEPPSSPAQPRLANLRESHELQPTTPGGLILPPFPPLDVTRPRHRSIVIPSLTISPRPNGVGQAQSSAIVNMRVQSVFEDEWDEDVVIGGKRMPGWMEKEEGQREVEKLGRLLEEMDYPPFSIQRLAELLLSPTTYHSSLGKFLRAIEKVLLVNTPWEPPTYTYVPGSAIPGSHPLYSNISSGGSAVSDESDADSTMPPGATTPMFSPIPFLVRPDSESGDDIRMAMKGIQEIRHADGRNTDEGLMSPLMLGGESSNSSGMFQFPPAPNVRSPTPEPEENISSPTLAGSEASDPGHQPYLGRVDELDTGPLTSTLPAHVNGFKPGLEHQDLGTGAGEGGNMRLHGMSERPMAISSTTTIGLRERPVAGLPRGGLSDRFVSGTTEEEEKKDE